MPKLIVTQVGTGEETPFDIGGNASIGRQPDNDLQLEGHGISRKHAQILFEN